MSSPVVQYNTRLVEEALQRVYNGARGGNNRNFGDPCVHKCIGKGPREEPPSYHRDNKVFLSYANLEVALSDPKSLLILCP